MNCIHHLQDKLIFALMELNTFIQHFEQELEQLPEKSLTGNTQFKKLESWNSMQALLTIAMVDEQYLVTLTAEDLKNVNTLQELFDLVQFKKTG